MQPNICLAHQNLHNHRLKFVQLRLKRVGVAQPITKTIGVAKKALILF